MSRDTIISSCGIYRYILWREWGIKSDEQPYVAFIGLNPSTADENNDDPTLRRCIDFTKSWGYESMCIVNLFAFRSSNPKLLLFAQDPIGSDNDKFLKKAINNADLIIAAWGNGGLLLNRGQVVKNSFKKNAYCFGLTKFKQPKHPLYIRKTQELIGLI